MKYKFYLSPLSALIILSSSFTATAITSNSNVSTYWKTYIDSRIPGSDLQASDYLPQDIPVLNNFSYAGYARGEKPIPTLQIVENSKQTEFDSATGYKVFNVDDFGAVPGDGKSDKQAIIKTIKAAEKYVSPMSGKGAIVNFSAGQYLINESSDMEVINPADKDSVVSDQVIRISQSNIILRGAGEGETELFMSEALHPVDATKMWTTPRILSFSAKRNVSLQTPIITAVVAGSSRSIEVKSSDLYHVGDWIRLNGLITRHEVIEKQVAPYKLEKAWKAINQGLNIHEYHQIAAIDNNNLTFYTPIQVDIEPQDTWSVQQYFPLVNVGLEELTIRGNWQDEFKHHQRSQDGTIHDSAWSLVEFNNAVNAWVRDVTFVDFNAALQLRNTAYSTVRDITMVGNTGHLSLQFNASFNNLSMNVDDRSGAWHAPGFSHASSSNVHYKTTYLANTSSDLHGAQPRINLFDNVKGGWINGRWGAAIANQPNHLKGLTYWNFEHTGKAVKDFELMRKNTPYGRLIAPYMIGNHGAPIQFASMKSYSDYAHATGEAVYETKLPELPQVHLESSGQSVYPQSLYQAQVELRLGYIPQWLK